MFFVWKTPPPPPRRSGDSLEVLGGATSPAPAEAAPLSADGRKDLDQLKGELPPDSSSVENLDEKSQAEAIWSIDINKSASEQLDKVRLFNIALIYETIPEALASGFKLRHFKNLFERPERLAEELREARQKHPGALGDLTTEAAFQKLLEVGRNPESALGREWKSEWPGLLERFKEQKDDAEALASGNTAKAAEAWEWVKNNKMRTALAVGIGIGALWILKDIFFGKKEDGKGEDGIGSKIMKGVLVAGIGGGAVALLTKILPTDKISSWLSSMWAGLPFTGNSEEKKEAAERERDKNELLEAAAQKLGLPAEDAEILDVIGEYEYEDFMSFMGEALGSVGAGLKKLYADKVWGNLADVDSALLPDSVKKFIKRRKEAPYRIATAEAKLRHFLKPHAAEIEKMYPRRTIRDVLEGLGRNGVFGEKFKSRVIQIRPDQVPAPVLASIDRHSPSVPEQNRRRQLALQAYERREAQKENLFGSTGLVARMEHMAKTDPSFNGKIEHVKELHSKLEDERGELEALTASGATTTEQIEEKVADVLEAQEELEIAATEYYAEVTPHMSAWAALPFFVARYSLLGPRKRAAVRAEIGRVFGAPAAAKEALDEVRNPAAATEKKLEKARRELDEFENKKGLAPGERARIRSAPGSPELEWRSGILKVEMLEKKLLLEQKKAQLQFFSAGFLQPDEINRIKGEILTLEKDYLRSHQAYFGASIEWAKKLLPEVGADISDQEKIAYINEIKAEKAQLRTALKEHQKRVMEEVKRLGKNTDAAKALIREHDEMLAVYRKTVRTELSFFSKLIGRDRGLRKQFVAWLKEEKESGFVKFAKNRAGRIGVLGLVLLPGLYFEKKDIEAKNPDIEFDDLMKDLGMASLQLLADVMPYTWGASDWYTISTGEEYFTKKQVRGWDRYSRIIWGSLGALLDTASVIPAVNLAGAPTNAIVKAARASGKLKEAKLLLRSWSRIADIAAKVGGWKAFFAKIKDFRAAGTRMAKLGHAAEAVRIAAPRVAASVIIGNIAYNAVYTMGEDVNEPGEEMDPEVVSDIEGQVEAGPAVAQADVPQAPEETTF